MIAALEPWRRSHDDGSNGAWGHATVRVRLRRVEVDAVARAKQMRLILERDFQSAVEYVHKFRAVVSMRRDLLHVPLGELRDVSLQALLLRRVGQALKEVRRFRVVRPVGKTDPLPFTNHQEELALPLVREEVVEAHIKNHADAGKRRQRRGEFPVLQLRQHGGGQPGVFAEVYQAHFLPQPQGVYLQPDLISRKHPRDSLLARLSRHKTHFSSAEDGPPDISATETSFIVPEKTSRSIGRVERREWKCL